MFSLQKKWNVEKQRLSEKAMLKRSIKKKENMKIKSKKNTEITII